MSETVSRNFGRVQEVLEIPNLTEIQTRKYEEFLQLDGEPTKRKSVGLESVLREVFPITSYDGSLRLDYVSYRLGRPRYTPDQCRALRLTYGRPFRVTVRLSGPAYAEPIEEEVYVGELPIMMGGGEFIINGAERVIVSQMHRSPGVDFGMKLEAGDRRIHSCRIIPERGSWIEMNVSRKDVLQMRIDQSSKIPVTAFLRAMDAKFADTETLIRLFYETKSLKLGQIKPGTPMQDMYVVGPVVDTGSVDGEDPKEARKRYLETDPGIEVKWYVTKKADGEYLDESDLEGLETKLMHEYPDPNSNKPIPKFNEAKKGKWNPGLEPLLKECADLISSDKGWYAIKTLDQAARDWNKTVPQEQGIYIFRNRKTGVVEYVGIAGLKFVAKSDPDLDDFCKVCTIEPEPIEDPGPRYQGERERRHKFGSGPFCKFKIPTGYNNKVGVYLLMVDDHLAYVGETEDLHVRYNVNYGSVSPSWCFDPAYTTDCMINSLIRKASEEPASVELYFRPTEEHKELEKRLIKRYDPPWNIKDIPTPRDNPLPYTKGERALLDKPQSLRGRLVERHLKGNLTSDNLLKKYPRRGVCDGTGEVVLNAGERIGEKWDAIRNSTIKQLEVVADPQCDPLLLNTLGEDKTTNYDDAILYIYGRLRVGNPPNLDKARQLFKEKFYDVNRYRLGRVGRFRLNRKFGTKVAEDEMTLRPEDFIECIRYVMRLRKGEGFTDDIDDLGNRRLRTIDELAGDEIRKGFLKLRRTVQERMSLKDPKDLTPRTLVNSKSVSSSIEFFFGRSELSQVVDQTNPLAQLANERRLSALGPGGLNRKRAGFEVRDVHVSHYGRICPIETPEGTNIGLIAQLGIYATVDPYGFLITPYRRVEKGRIVSGGNGNGHGESDDREQKQSFLNEETYPYPPGGLPQKEFLSIRKDLAETVAKAAQRGVFVREERIAAFRYIRERVREVLINRGRTWKGEEFKEQYFQQSPGFEVTWFRTSGSDGKPLGKTDLELVEAEVLRANPSPDHSDDKKYPRLNKGPGRKGDLSEEALRVSKACLGFLGAAVWIPISDMPISDKREFRHVLMEKMWTPQEAANLDQAVLDAGPQGLYFFRPLGEGLKSGYIGISGKVKGDDPESKGLIDRIYEHVWGGDWGPKSESTGEYTGADNSFIESIIADWEFRALEKCFESTLQHKARNQLKGKLDSAVRYMRADEEMQHTLAPADIPVDAHGRITADAVVARVKGDFRRIKVEEVEYVDISPKQLVGVSASLIPFLEHDDANRALMGSNMQRQAVPLLAPKPPVVATGMERPVAENSGMVVRTKEAGEVTYVDSSRIVVKNRDGWETEYVLRKFVGLNERTCLNQKPIVQLGQKVKRNQVLADGPGTSEGELALGRDVTVAFMTYDGYNFEDAILVSESLLKDDRFTSIHIDEYEVEVRETKLGREEFTRDIPNVSERQLRNLDELGIIRIGTRVEPGDLLVGKVSPKSKAELSPEEKLLHAIFGRAGEDVKNDSLVVPAGTEGIVISAEKYSRVAHLSDQERRRRSREAKKIEKEMNDRIFAAFRALVETLNSVLRTKIADPVTGAEYGQPRDEAVLLEQIDKFDYEKLETRSQSFDEGREISRREWPKIQELVDEKERQVARLKRGDELPTGVLEMVKVWIATKRTLAVGDKMAGRHGNKGVIARILPVEDMPFMPDGRPVEILLNPLGVPSRMNVGQILETHLGWAAAVLGFQALTPVFDGCKEDTIHDLLEEAGLPRDGKTVLYDGRTGEAFDQRVTVGHIYMMKLHHLVDDKVHARATGPYSLITQQPLGGKARSGGQRFGEMEVWALEAYGAAYILQELLTVKSDDVEGRTKIYESMVMGRNTLEAGTPVSFDVLCNEIKGLCLNIQLEKKRL